MKHPAGQFETPLSPSNSPSTSPKYEQFYNTVSKLIKGIVFCYSGNSKTTGFFVTTDGWILTAGHKVDIDFPEANIIHVKLKRISKDSYQSAKIIVPTPGLDLLLFKIDYKPKYYFKTFRNPGLLEENWVLGFRGDAGISLSPAGFVSSYIREPSLLLTTAPVYYGNSGSPVINRDGRVLGVLVKGHPFGDGAFIPASVVKEYIQTNLKNK